MELFWYYLIFAALALILTPIAKHFTKQLQDKNSSMELFYAIAKNDVKLSLKTIETQDFDPNQLVGINLGQQRPEYPLVIACEAASPELVAKLIEKGANPNLTNDPHGWTPLFYAIARRNCSIVDILLQAGSDASIMLPAHAGKHASMTPLVLALAIGSPEVLKLLIEHGLNLNSHTPSLQNQTPFLTSIQFLPESLECMTILAECGAEVCAIDSEGRNALHLAAAYNKLEHIDFLIALGVDLNHPDKSDHTLLSYAVEWGTFPFVEHLVNLGAKIRTSDIEIARTKGFKNILALLEERFTVRNLTEHNQAI